MSSMKWFRFYSEALDDPKVQRLDGDTFKAWINLLCLAARNDGCLPEIGDIAFALRVSVDGARTVVERLLSGGLIDRVSGGPSGWRYAPHAWQERQFKSDTSNERVKRYRQRARNATETAPDTDTETEKNTPPTPQAEQPASPPRDDGIGEADAGYAYRGKIIRLTRSDFAQWEAAFHTIADLKAELIALDAWLQGPDVKDATRKKWFMTVSGALNKKHQENLARGPAEPSPRNRQEADEAAAERLFNLRYPPRKITLSEAEGMMQGAELERWKARNLHS